MMLFNTLKKGYLIINCLSFFVFSSIILRIDINTNYNIKKNKLESLWFNHDSGKYIYASISCIYIYIFFHLYIYSYSQLINLLISVFVCLTFGFGFL